MTKNNSSRLLPSIISSIAIFIFFEIMFLMYKQSGYIPFLLIGIFFVLLGSLNLILLLFHSNIPLKEQNRKAMPPYLT